jgi:hypothetical protein
VNKPRYFKVDLDFWHKSTCHRLLEELGPWGPCVFLSLVAEAKRSSIPGRVVVTSMESLQERLGLLQYDLPFTLDEFLALTGRLKQTSRTPVGRLTHVVLTHYGQWQRDWKREDDRDRKNPRNPPDSTPEDDATETLTSSRSSSSATKTPGSGNQAKAQAWLANAGHELDELGDERLREMLREDFGLHDLDAARVVSEWRAA